MSRLLLLSLAVLCACQTLLGDEPKDANEEAYRGPVVVLKNGTVLRGKGTNLGEKIAVELADGGEVKLPKGQVEVVADSLDDAYLQRREKLLPENVLSQINLAYWCLDQGMKVEANIHLREAKKIDSSHPGISRLQRKIKEVSRASEEELPEPAVEQQPKEDLKDLLKKRLESARRETRLESGEVSPAVKIRFNKEILPILMSSCAASRCHGPNSASDFRLVRSSSHADNHAVLVKRNLQNVASRLNVDAPDESPLLEKSVTVHATGMKAPPIEISSRDFSKLLDWVAAATDDLSRPKNGGYASSSEGPSASGKAPATIAPNSSGPAANRPSRNAPSEDELPEERLHRGRNNEERLAERPADKPAEKPNSIAPKRSSGGKASSKQEPREQEEPDGGDPSEFNRKYFPDGPK